MMPPLPRPGPLPLPAPPWLLWLLLTLTFALHLLAMNLALGGSIIGLIARLRGRRQPHAARLASLVARGLPVIVAMTVTMGVAALLFVQALYGRLFFVAAVLLAVPWLAVVPILVAAYYAACAGQRSARAVWAWVSAAGLLAIAFVYANVMGLALRPGEFLSRFQSSASGMHLDLQDPTLVPRFLHVVLGALAVSGMGVAIAGAVLRRREPGTGEWMTRHGVYLCTGGTILNLLPGFWWLAALPGETLLLFMGRDPVATACFAFGLLGGMAAIGLAIPAAFATTGIGVGSPRVPATLRGAAACLAGCVVLMVLVRDLARSAILGGAGAQGAPHVVPQWGPIAAFAVLLVAAVATVGWMVTKLARAKKEEPLGQP